MKHKVYKVTHTHTNYYYIVAKDKADAMSKYEKHEHGKHRSMLTVSFKDTIDCKFNSFLSKQYNKTK